MIDTDYDNFDGDDYLDDGSISDLSDHFRSFSFQSDDLSGIEGIDRETMFAFLIEMGLEPSLMSNEEIMYEFNAIMSGHDESVDEGGDD